MLAQRVISLFGEKDLYELSKNERKVALERHDRINTAIVLKNIYNDIIARYNEYI